MNSETKYLLNNDISSVESITQMRHLLNSVRDDIKRLMYHNDELKHDIVSKDDEIKKLKEKIEDINRKNSINNLVLNTIIGRKLTLKERLLGKINI